MSDINFEYYKVFYYVAKFHSITSAANALYLSQPSVSRCIHNLEQSMGCALFNRSKKGVTLTAEGNLLFKHIQIACKHIFSAEEDIFLMKEHNIGILRIGATDVTFQSYLISHVNDFHRKYPAIKLKIDNMTTPSALESLRSNLIDIALVSSPFENKEELSITFLDNIQDIVVAGNDFVALKDKVISMHDLINYPLISLQEGTTTRRYLDSLFRQHNTLLHPDIELTTVNQILPLVKNNLGIGFSQLGMAASEIESGNIFQINIKENIPARKICAVTCTKYPVNPIMKNFLDTVTK